MKYQKSTLQVLKEGRCALANATMMFKFIFFYAIIQATSIVILFRSGRCPLPVLL